MSKHSRFILLLVKLDSVAALSKLKMDWFDLMSSEHFHVILHPDKKHGLIFNRLDDTVATINHDDAKELCNLKKIGRIYGIVGRYLGKFLVLIKNRALVGLLYDPNTKKEHEIYVVTQVQVVDVSCVSRSSQDSTKGNTVRYDAAFERNDQDSNESVSFKDLITTADQDFSSLPITISTSSYINSARSRAAPWNPFRIANSFKPRMATQFLRPTTFTDTILGDNMGSGTNLASQTDESDKRLVDEMIKLFNNTNSFYFSPTLDLTNRFSRKRQIEETSGKEALWKTADKQFFWNRHMLNDLIELSERDDDANYFIRVILQGFITIENQTKSSSSFSSIGIETGRLATSTNSITTAINNNSSNNMDCDENSTEMGEKISTQTLARNYQLALVSRRSVYRAGTRYRRRGCDENGNCANFVETEQIFRYNKHFTSVVILRGSIPLYWYQTGYNYRPPPVLCRNDDENHEAFVKHFTTLIESYRTEQIISVDCTEQSGREKCLHDAYKRHMEKLKASKPNLELIEFDFHKLCRGRQCSDIQVEKNLRGCGLTDDMLKDARYYWNDGEVVWNQGGVFRVNCLDCSDRTNVVQRAIALQILDQQLSRLGVIAPDTCPEDNEYRRAMQAMWSTNGNVLSTQYCGTRALFTGERKLSGYLKDTYSSASRYYISKFRDAYRQAAIDAMLGVEDIGEPNVGGQANQEPPLDQYELTNLDPIMSRGGGALLRGVGSKVTDRFARLRGRFYVKPLELNSMNVSSGIHSAESELMEARVSETLDGLNIDWPSSESVGNIDTNPSPRNNVFAQLSNSDDSFQDDEFGQLMLSIDLADLHRIRDDEYDAITLENNSQKEKDEVREGINLTEACGPTNKQNSSLENKAVEVETSTTST